jgi:hypothetical protein
MNQLLPYPILTVVAATPRAECGVGVARLQQKSDPGRVQPSESRLRTRTRIALTSGIRQRWFVSRSKEDLKTLAVSQNNELTPLLKIPHILLIFCVTIDTVFTVIEW